MLIQPHSFHHWLNHFYGYGSWQAPVWFVGYEEGGGDLPEEVSEKFEYFSAIHPAATLPTLCDIRALYRNVNARMEGPRAELFKTLYDYRFDKKAVLHGVWKNLIAFTHGYQGKKLPDLLAYQKKSFASPEVQREALIQLHPLPSPHAHAWYYAWLDMPGVTFLKSRAQYEKHVYPQRMHSLLQGIITYKPEVVVMYAMSNINALKSSVQEFFPDAKFKMIKGTKLEIPQHHRTDLDATRMIITTQMPALRHNRIETGFDWHEFGKMVKSEH